jgi:hypothetical protein
VEPTCSTFDHSRPRAASYGRAENMSSENSRIVNEGDEIRISGGPTAREPPLIVAKLKRK